MRKLLAAVGLLSAAMMPASAHAATLLGYYNNITGNTGTFTFGNNDPASPTFSDSYEFTTAFARYVTIDITSLMKSKPGMTCSEGKSTGCDYTTNVNFVSNGVKLTGVALSKVIPATSTGVFEERYLANFRLPAGVQQILVKGSSGVNGTYAGILTLSGVPEPATWALMILGFGLTGAALRRRRAQVTTGVSFA